MLFLLKGFPVLCFLQNAILLLKYHEMMNKSERRRRNDRQWRLSVLDHEVDKIVKVGCVRKIIFLQQHPLFLNNITEILVYIQ